MKHSIGIGIGVFKNISLLLITFFFLQSCSTDSVSGVEMEDAITDDMDNPIKDPIDEIDEVEETEEPASGIINFEQGFSLDDDRRLASLILPQADYNAFIEGDGDLKLVSEKAYQYLEDDFDFLIILSVEATQPPDLFYGRATGVQNAVEGLGIGTYNNSSAYGSAERLKSIIYMPRSEYIRSGPFLHEIAHTWANKGFLPTTVGGHWGYASIGGQLGGFDELEELGGNSYIGKMNGTNGFGAFANGGNSVPYGNLELYLMGLIGAQELEPVQVAVNPEYVSNSGEFTADSIETYTAASLIAEHGERVPSHVNSQKEFKALTVIISAESLSEEKINAINTDLENFSRLSAPDANWGSSNNFWLATQGKGSFDFEINQESIK